MKVAIVVTDTKGKNLVFGTDDLRAYSLQEAIQLVKARHLESVLAVGQGRGEYLRARPDAVRDNNLDVLSVSAHQLFLSLDDVKYLLSKEGRDAYRRYLMLHGRSIEERGEHVIYIDGYPLVTIEQVTARLTPHRSIIQRAAKQYSIDPFTLGAIIIDEIARANPWEEILDKLGMAFIGKNTSAGIAQVRISTARDLIKTGYYNPNPDDDGLSAKKIMKTSKAYLYAYVEQPRHSIHFAAARIRQTIDYWAHKIDLSDRPEILGTLYSRGLGEPKFIPGANDRGLQISQQFYPLAKAIIKP